MIPKHAKKVFKGIHFDTYHWDQKMYDGSTRTFEKVKRSNGVAVIATVGKKIVVLYQQQPGKQWYYSLPGGMVDPGETPKQAIIRELQEETALKPKKITLWKTFNSGFRVDSTYTVFIAKDCAPYGTQKLDGGEKIEVEYRTFEEFLLLSDDPKYHGHEITIELLRARLSKKYRDELKKLIFG